MPRDRQLQDYKSTYNDFRERLIRDKESDEQEQSSVDWDDVVFEVDLLKSQDINLDYILDLIFEKNKNVEDKSEFIAEVRRIIRTSLGIRAKEGLLVDFINQTDLDQFDDRTSLAEAFITFAQREKRREANELIKAESLDDENAKRYFVNSIKRGFASDRGTELNAILPKMSPLNPKYLANKRRVFLKVSEFVEKFNGFHGEI